MLLEKSTKWGEGQGASKGFKCKTLCITEGRYVASSPGPSVSNIKYMHLQRDTDKRPELCGRQLERVDISVVRSSGSGSTAKVPNDQLDVRVLVALTVTGLGLQVLGMTRKMGTRIRDGPLESSLVQSGLVLVQSSPV